MGEQALDGVPLRCRSGSSVVKISQLNYHAHTVHVDDVYMYVHVPMLYIGGRRYSDIHL